ncbi:MAG: hypothetical protein J6A26_02710, partial [Oscillospiraceae bacterium]|nr:hypothetical protein [Oscillospiraceae bacterium]
EEVQQLSPDWSGDNGIFPFHSGGNCSVAHKKHLTEKCWFLKTQNRETNPIIVPTEKKSYHFYKKL